MAKSAMADRASAEEKCQATDKPGVIEKPNLTIPGNVPGSSHPEKAPFPDGSFTPGPWRVDDFAVPSPRGRDRYIRSDARHWAVGAVYELHGCTDPELDITQPEAEANARLIAAAPELYEACRCALGALTGNMDGDIELGDPLEMLRAALSKATGGQHV